MGESIFLAVLAVVFLVTVFFSLTKKGFLKTLYKEMF